MPYSRPLIAALLACASLVSASALAQEPARPASKADRETQRRTAFDRVDANRDGFIDRAESRAARNALFERFDANKDGKLSPEELPSARRSRAQSARTRDGGVNAQTEAAPRRGRAGAGGREFQRLDTDKDGFVSRNEWIAGDDSRFRRCDKNGDGKLAFGECRVAQAGRRSSPGPAIQQ